MSQSVHICHEREGFPCPSKKCTSIVPDQTAVLRILKWNTFLAQQIIYLNKIKASLELGKKRGWILSSHDSQVYIFIDLVLNIKPMYQASIPWDALIKATPQWYSPLNFSFSHFSVDSANCLAKVKSLISFVFLHLCYFFSLANVTKSCFILNASNSF